MRTAEGVGRRASPPFYFFAMAFTVGMMSGPTDAFAKSPPVRSGDTLADPAAVRDLEARLVALLDEVSTDLEARVEAKTSSIADRATEQQTAVLLQRNLATRNRISNRVGDPVTEAWVVMLGMRADDRPR